MKKKDQKRKNDKVCPKCGGSQFIITEEGSVPCECREEALLKMRLAAAEIPRRFRNKTLAGFKARDKKRKKLLDYAKSYVRTFNPRRRDRARSGILYMADVGRGKSHLAIGILKGVIEKGYDGRYCNVVDFFTRLRDSFGGDADYDEMDMLQSISKADLLVLDDLGAEKPTEWIRDRLYNLINQRYENDLPVIVTTNKLDVEELKEHVGPRSVSRLCEMCWLQDEFPEEDYRMKDLKI